MSVQRFKKDTAYNLGSIVPAPFGEWVKYSDYQKLEREVERLKEQEKEKGTVPLVSLLDGKLESQWHAERELAMRDSGSHGLPNHGCLKSTCHWD